MARTASSLVVGFAEFNINDLRRSAEVPTLVSPIKVAPVIARAANFTWMAVDGTTLPCMVINSLERINGSQLSLMAGAMRECQGVACS